LKPANSEFLEDKKNATPRVMDINDKTVRSLGKILGEIVETNTQTSVDGEAVNFFIPSM
jgi:predicted nuclease of restriction endonuclease-like RecB superfamily